MGNKLNRHAGPKFLLIKSLERPLVHKFTLRPNKSSHKWQKTQKRDKWSKAQAKGQLGQDEARFTFPGKSRGFPDSRLFGNDYLPRFSCSASGLRMQFKDSDSLSVDLISNNNLVMCATCVDFHWKIIIPHKIWDRRKQWSRWAAQMWFLALPMSFGCHVPVCQESGIYEHYVVSKFHKIITQSQTDISNKPRLTLRWRFCHNKGDRNGEKFLGRVCF